MVFAHTNASRRPPPHISFVQQGQQSPGQVNIIYFQTFDQATIVNVSFQPPQARELNPFNCSVSKISTRYSIILINILFLWYIEAYFHTITVETCFKTVHFQKKLLFFPQHFGTYPSGTKGNQLLGISVSTEMCYTPICIGLHARFYCSEPATLTSEDLDAASNPSGRRPFLDSDGCIA